jgi:hypothetical protein
MKKFSIIMLAAGAVLLLVGFAWSGFSFTKIGHDISHISKVGLTDKHAAFAAADIQNVRFTLDNEKVRFVGDAHTTDITVAYYQTKYTSFSVKDDNGTLTILRRDTGHTAGLCMWRCLTSAKTIVITLPAAQAYAYNVTTSNTALEFAGPMTANTLRAAADNGGLELTDVIVHGKLELHSSNAKTSLMNVQATSIVSSADNGGADFTRVKADSITATASNAQIMLDRLQASTIHLTSDNGGVSGTILGNAKDYSINAHADNGSLVINNVRYDSTYVSEGQRKTLTVRSSNATTKLNFVPKL